MALGLVFEVAVEELLLDPDLAADKRALELARDYTRAYDNLATIADQLTRHVIENPRVTEAVATLLDWSEEAKRRVLGIPGLPGFYDPKPASEVYAQEAVSAMQREDEEETDGLDS